MYTAKQLESEMMQTQKVAAVRAGCCFQFKIHSSFTCFPRHNQGLSHFCSSRATLREKDSGAWVEFTKFAATQKSKYSAFRSAFSQVPGQNICCSWL